jgi:hypothetical protein
MKQQNEAKGVDPDEITDVERQYILDEYHVILGPFTDYASLIIQFGYATMFIAAYPLATFMSFVSNYVRKCFSCLLFLSCLIWSLVLALLLPLELRVDAWRLCQQCRRPEPRSVEDIGTWYTILEIVSFAAVLVNSGLVAFTGTNTINFPWFSRVWIFFGMATGIVLLKFLIAAIIPDTPAEVQVQLNRNAYYIKKIIHNVPDDDNDALVIGEMNKVNNKYTIRINDDDPL